MNKQTKMLFSNFGLNIVTLAIGTLFFGVLLESFKSDELLKADIVKDYYRPMIAKEATCASLNMSIVKNYNDIGSYYSLMRDQYLSFKDGTGPKLTDEYKNYLAGLLSDVRKKSSSADDLNGKYIECRSDLEQLQVDLSLVTGTYEEIATLIKERNDGVMEMRDKFKSEHVTPFMKSLPPNSVSKLTKGFFDAGDLTNPVDKSQDEFLTNMINDVMPSLIKIFPATANLNVRISSIDNKYDNMIDDMAKAEINKRFKRGFISKILN